MSDPRGKGLALRGLGKAYGPIDAVAGVSLDITPGEFVALLGPSGSGKTTTLLMIAGFVLPDAGRVLLDGRDITTLPPHRRNLGMVYQSYALFPHLTVARNVAFPLEVRRVPRADIRRRVERALEHVQLGGLDGRYPRQLSGGQQQRVALARALVFEPPVLLMDEPLGALDRQLRGEMQQEIKTIQRRFGITTVYVTHDQEEALSMADRVVVMRGGRIEQAAAPTELYDRPASAFVAEFLGAANLLRGRVAVAGPPSIVETDGGLRFPTARAPAPAGASVTAVLRPERITVTTAGDGVAGRVVDAAFGGGVWRYRVALTSGETVLATQSNLGAAPFAPGGAVVVGWRADDVWLIADGA
jgi:spermidine/putrescine ABC transporter ATP-binding subunit